VISIRYGAPDSAALSGRVALNCLPRVKNPGLSSGPLSGKRRLAIAKIQ
jgi:hypothetical protein